MKTKYERNAFPRHARHRNRNRFDRPVLPLHLFYHERHRTRTLYHNSLDDRIYHHHEPFTWTYGTDRIPTSNGNPAMDPRAPVCVSHRHGNLTRGNHARHRTASQTQKRQRINLARVNIELIGYAATICSTLWSLPQTIKAIRTDQYQTSPRRPQSSSSAR